jgi:hypothetical protein
MPHVNWELDILPVDGSASKSSDDKNCKWYSVLVAGENTCSLTQLFHNLQRRSTRLWRTFRSQTNVETFVIMNDCSPFLVANYLKQITVRVCLTCIVSGGEKKIRFFFQNKNSRTALSRRTRPSKLGERVSDSVTEVKMRLVCSRSAGELHVSLNLESLNWSCHECRNVYLGSIEGGYQWNILNVFSNSNRDRIPFPFPF